MAVYYGQKPKEKGWEEEEEEEQQRHKGDMVVAMAPTCLRKTITKFLLRWLQFVALFAAS